MTWFLFMVLSLPMPSQGNEQDQNEITRHEIEARAKAYESRMDEMHRQIVRNQETIQQNQQTIAELRGRLSAWGAIISILSGSGLLIAILGHYPRTKENK